MDPFTERQLLDAMKSVATSLQGIRTELADINLAIHEAAEAQAEYLGEDDEEEDKEEECKE